VLRYTEATYQRVQNRYNDAAQREIAIRGELASAEAALAGTEIPPLLTQLGPILDP
jgi:hypothetical protein